MNLITINRSKLVGNLGDDKIQKWQDFFRWIHLDLLHANIRKSFRKIKIHRFIRIQARIPISFNRDHSKQLGKNTEL